MSTAAAARRYLRSRRAGVLGTLSAKLGGYPFGSIVPVVLDHAAQPLLLVSRLAEHTKNIAADPRVSLLVQDDAIDAQASARLTLVGDAHALEPSDALRDRYCRYHPQGVELLALGDFSFFAIRPLTLRYIEGFGGIHWVSAAAFAPPANDMAEIEREVLEHMNADHTAALADYARAAGAAAEFVAMIGIDCDGIDLRAGERVIRIDFDAPVTNACAARKALIAMADRARA